ncbi:Stage II sporulation protein E (SpoIIE) [Pedococcus cremeus]|uniref:Stage II sporulation protein E (SpoIIE) n=1 Tax=Pedococcus cremeus TaxID=587636 RepID=A0A1H9UPF4_9MICO|nr:PP2C family protein-serine/threonine phosphatase [Pedococcus cremeus]SES11400.1 Stage II sporulation protein E (SpoIIE) [Pedococcus cremeus]
MEVHSEVLARRRLTTRLQRYLRSHPTAIWTRAVQPTTAALLCGGVLVTTVAMGAWPDVLPFSSLIPFAVLAGLLLRPGLLAVVDAVIMACATVVALARTDGDLLVYLNALVVLAVVMVIMFTVATSRARLGVQGTLGETMLVDLRDRLRTQGELPDLPREWGAEQCVLSAYGDSFSGDFVVTSKTDGYLEIALVDVSGKGVAAGTRSLLLSGAFGGLLGSMPVDRFLPAANAYLLRQQWDEGFATAVHAFVDLETGAFSIGSAGHPPVARFSAGSGRWQMLEAVEGPVLGVNEGVGFPRTTGLLQRGDALLLYTDGVIETRNRALGDGIDRMLGTAERMITRGFEGMAERMCVSARAGETDDRAAVIVWRR